jgi:hypothetical protein
MSPRTDHFGMGGLLASVAPRTSSVKPADFGSRDWPNRNTCTFSVSGIDKVCPVSPERRLVQQRPIR